jgi:hypothetical protein
MASASNTSIVAARPNQNAACDSSPRALIVHAQQEHRFAVRGIQGDDLFQ